MNKNSKPLTNEEGEVRELTTADFKRFRPADEVLPPDLLKTLGIRRRGPNKAPTKQQVTVRLSPEVLASFKAAGRGWQARIDEALKTFIKEHPHP